MQKLTRTKNKQNKTIILKCIISKATHNMAHRQNRPEKTLFVPQTQGKQCCSQATLNTSIWIAVSPNLPLMVVQKQAPEEMPIQKIKLRT